MKTIDEEMKELVDLKYKLRNIQDEIEKDLHNKIRALEQNIEPILLTLMKLYSNKTFTKEGSFEIKISLYNEYGSVWLYNKNSEKIIGMNDCSKSADIYCNTHSEFKKIIAIVNEFGDYIDPIIRKEIEQQKTMYEETIKLNKLIIESYSKW